jgi:hypothetical protein
MSWALELMPVILATQEAEIKRILIRSLTGQIVHETISPKHPSQKRAGGMTQGVDPEFKTPGLPKKKKKKSRKHLSRDLESGNLSYMLPMDGQMAPCHQCNPVSAHMDCEYTCTPVHKNPVYYFFKRPCFVFGPSKTSQTHS